jgi:hypothetical protein
MAPLWNHETPARPALHIHMRIYTPQLVRPVASTRLKPLSSSAAPLYFFGLPLVLAMTTLFEPF